LLVALAAAGKEAAGVVLVGIVLPYLENLRVVGQVQKAH
tara:strand:- start:641 stop:757 length:117 start_codon:yes stop_codon:yes gene_type:complete